MSAAAGIFAPATPGAAGAAPAPAAPAPGAAPAPAPGAAPAPTAAPAAPAAAPWYGEVDDATRATIDAKKWASPGDVLKSYTQLEKFVGKDPAAIVAIPKEGDTEGQAAMWNKLGRPEKPEGYKVPEALAPALKGDALVGAFSAAAHEHGLTGKQYEGMLTWFAKATADVQSSGEQAFKTQSDAELATFKAQAGNGWARQEAAVKAAGEQLGLTTPEAEALERAMGTKRFLEQLSKHGEQFLEPMNVNGQQRLPSGQMTPAQARQELKSLGSDPTFRAQLTANDPKALARKRELDAAVAGMSVADFNAQLAGGGGIRRPGGA